jgi:hypothetical protein
VKKSELRKLVSEYVLLKQKQQKHGVKNSERLGELEHRYFHETGRSITDDLKQSISHRIQEKT